MRNTLNARLPVHSFVLLIQKQRERLNRACFDATGERLSNQLCTAVVLLAETNQKSCTPSVGQVLRVAYILLSSRGMHPQPKCLSPRCGTTCSRGIRKLRGVNLSAKNGHRGSRNVSITYEMCRARREWMIITSLLRFQRSLLPPAMCPVPTLPRSRPFSQHQLPCTRAQGLHVQVRQDLSPEAGPRTLPVASTSIPVAVQGTAVSNLPRGGIRETDRNKRKREGQMEILSAELLRHLAISKLPFGCATAPAPHTRVFDSVCFP